jgi:excisionase family DNA binding protein
MPNNDKQTFERRALSIAEAAQAIGVHRATVYKLINENKLVTRKIGTRRVVPVGAIDDLLAADVVFAPDTPPTPQLPSARKKRPRQSSA